MFIENSKQYNSREKEESWKEKEDRYLQEREKLTRIIDKLNEENLFLSQNVHWLIKQNTQLKKRLISKEIDYQNKQKPKASNQKNTSKGDGKEFKDSDMYVLNDKSSLQSKQMDDQLFNHTLKRPTYIEQLSESNFRRKTDLQNQKHEKSYRKAKGLQLTRENNTKMNKSAGVMIQNTHSEYYGESEIDDLRSQSKAEDKLNQNKSKQFVNTSKKNHEKVDEPQIKSVNISERFEQKSNERTKIDTNSKQKSNQPVINNVQVTFAQNEKETNPQLQEKIQVHHKKTNNPYLVHVKSQLRDDHTKGQKEAQSKKSYHDYLSKDWRQVYSGKKDVVGIYHINSYH